MKNKPPYLHAIVLAAGLSRRMGTANKLLLPYGQHTILEEVLTQLSQTDIRGITVVLGHEAAEVKKVLAKFSVSAVFNPDYADGQGSSIRAGVKALPLEIDGFLICLGDMPTIQTKHYQWTILRFQAALSQNPLVIWRPFRQDKPGHPVGFAAHYQSAILTSPENDGCRSVIVQNQQHLLKWETAEEAYFQDVDTKEDYEKELR